LHRLHPLTKVRAVVLVILAAYLLPGLLTPTALFCGLVLLAYLSGIGGWFLRTVLMGLLPIFFSIFVIQGILFPPSGATPLPIGPVTLTREGLAFAFITSTRLLTFSSAVLLMLRTTHPADLVFAFTERGLPRNVGYILLVTLQIAPDMIGRATAILDAQRSRGLETKGVYRRVRAIAPLVGPLVVGALVDVEERAMALESRAYTARGPKTSLRQLADTPGQRAARVLLLLAIITLIAVRLAFAFDII
jgi:energy-coupling factor transport system permease protein